MESMDWLEDDYYHLLGISQGATTEEINKAYRLKAKQTHPDTYPLESPERHNAEKKFRHLLSVRDTLLDNDKRSEYDNQLLIQQQCYLSYIATNYSLPLVKEEPKKPSFIDKLKEEIEKQKSPEKNSDYVYSEEENSYIPEASYNEVESMTKEEKARYLKKQSAKKCYAMALQYLNYKDYSKAMTYFKSAQYLDPSIRIPKHYFP